MKLYKKWKEEEKQISQELINSRKELAKHLEDLTEVKEKEIKSKDRVDITLEEYNRLVEENKRLTQENDYLKSLFDSINLPYNKSIDVKNVKTATQYDPIGCTMTYMIRYRCEDLL